MQPTMQPTQQPTQSVTPGPMPSPVPRPTIDCWNISPPDYAKKCEAAPECYYDTRSYTCMPISYKPN
jgi:hypothetical protein